MDHVLNISGMPVLGVWSAVCGFVAMALAPPLPPQKVLQIRHNHSHGSFVAVCNSIVKILCGYGFGVDTAV